MPKRPIKPSTLRDADTPAKLSRFTAEHPSDGDSEAFNDALGRMAGVPAARPDAPKKPGKK